MEVPRYWQQMKLTMNPEVMGVTMGLMSFIASRGERISLSRAMDEVVHEGEIFRQWAEAMILVSMNDWGGNCD